MRLCINYIDSDILLSKEYVTSIEIENKKRFYLFVDDLNRIANDQIIEEIGLYDENSEVNMTGKFTIVIDYFNIDFNSKVNLNIVSKLVRDNISEKERIEITGLYNKIQKTILNSVNDYPIPLEIVSEFDLNVLLKVLKISIHSKPLLMDKILLLIDLHRELNRDKTIIFVNSKQLLSKEEISELYKYAIYNQVQMLLIDYGYYGVALENEKKIIIDETLEEFVL